MKDLEASDGRSRVVPRWCTVGNGFEIWASHARIFERFSLRQVPRRAYCYAKVCMSVFAITKESKGSFRHHLRQLRSTVSSSFGEIQVLTTFGLFVKLPPQLQSMTYIQAFRSSAYINDCFFSCPWVITFAVWCLPVGLPQLALLGSPSYPAAPTLLHMECIHLVAEVSPPRIYCMQQRVAEDKCWEQIWWVLRREI